MATCALKSCVREATISYKQYRICHKCWSEYKGILGGLLK